MAKKNIKDDIEKILISGDEIEEIVGRISANVDDYYRDRDSRLLLLGILKGSVVFMGELMKKITVPVEIDFMKVSSYGGGTSSSGSINIILDLYRKDLSNTDILIVEDIIDSGLNMQYLRQLFGARNPASITTISFLDKASRHPESYKTDMCGFEIPDEFVVGYGLDYANYYRNLPYIGILKPECYK